VPDYRDSSPPIPNYIDSSDVESCAGSVGIMAFIARAIPLFSRTPLYATNVVRMSYGPTSSPYNQCDATLLYLRELAPN
jgi:hypothetical protein